MRKRLVVAAGGTGGHFFPGVSLAEELRRRGWETLFLLRTGDPALPALEARGFSGAQVDLRGLPRGLSLDLLRFGPRLLRAVSFVGRVVEDFRPDVVAGMGGYLTFPLALAAARRGLPRLVHEANASLGLANRAARLLGARVLWGLPPVPGEGPGEVVGTPIRAELCARLPDAAAARRELGLTPELQTLLVFGGSQGARGINREVPAALKRASKHKALAQVLHLSGAPEEAAVRAAYEGCGLPVHVLPFLGRMDLAYAAADLAVCRSGASTLAELSAQRLPALLVPYPSAAGNHQEHNARIFERAKACRLLLEADLPGALAPALEDLVFSKGAQERREAMRQAFARLDLPEAATAAGRLADSVESAARKP